jgi:hypothetical protein
MNRRQQRKQRKGTSALALFPLFSPVPFSMGALDYERI